MLYSPNGTSCCNLKAASFIATLAQLGTELLQFRDEERGGLLSVNGLGHHKMLQRFAGAWNKYDGAQDAVYLQVVQLRQLGLLKKGDILDHNLLHKLSNKDNYFSERRF